MRINPEHDNTPDFGEDPIDMLPDKFKEKLTYRSMALANYLGDRQKYFENLLGASEDSSSMSLVERLSFYEMTIDSLIAKSNAQEIVMQELDKRIEKLEGKS